MDTDKYVIINSDDQYFEKIYANNVISFCSNIDDAVIVNSEDGQELITFIKNTIGKTCKLKSIKDR